MSKSEMALVPRLRFTEFSDCGEWENRTIQKCIADRLILDHLDGNHGELYPKSEEFTEKGVPYISANDFIEGKVDFYSCKRLPLERAKKFKKGVAKDNDILFAHNATVGPVALLKTQEDFVILSTTATYFRCNEDKLSNIFLANTLQSNYFVRQYSRIMKQSTRNQVPITAQRKLEITVPFLPEQEKIADCLSSLDDLISAEDKKLNSLKDHKKGLMQKLFPAEGKTVPEFRFSEFKDSGQWEETTLKKLADFRRGSFPQPYGLPEWYDEKNGVPFVQVFDVGENLRLKAKTKNKISELASKQSVFIAKETIIITIQGSIGRVAITQYDAYIDRTLLLFEKFHIKIDKTFIAYIMQLLFAIEKEKAPGGIIKTITKEVLSAFVVKIPDIKEQQKIANCLSSVDELISAQSEKTESLKLHKKGLMQGLFPSFEEVCE